MDITEAPRAARRSSRGSELEKGFPSTPSASPQPQTDYSGGNTFRRRVRRQTLLGDVGFTTFTSGIRAGWYVELGATKFRQVGLFVLFCLACKWR